MLDTTSLKAVRFVAIIGMIFIIAYFTALDLLISVNVYCMLAT